MSQPQRFMFDECLGKPAMRRLLEIVPGNPHFEHVCDLYGQGKGDDVWIPEIAAQGGWVVITGDRARQSGKDDPKLPLICREYGVTHVLLSKTIHHMKAHQKVAAIAVVWEQIVEDANKYPAGTRFILRLRHVRRTPGVQIALVYDEPK